MHDPDLERIAQDDVWQSPAARDLALWLVALAAPTSILFRPAWVAQVAFHALTRRKMRGPRG